MDNYYTGTRSNIATLLGDPQFEAMRHDVTFPFYLEVDRIFNLACPASPVHYQYDPVQTTKTSVHGAINMLGLAKRLAPASCRPRPARSMATRTCIPRREAYWGNVNPIGLRACYDEGKRCAETLFFDYHRQHNVDIKVARIFNTYGPRMHPKDGRVVSNFIVQALRGEPITLYGDGSQTRSFCYVDDLVEGLLRLMDTPAGVTGPVNLGNPVEFTIRRAGRERVLRADRVALEAGIPAVAGGRPEAAPPGARTSSRGARRWTPVTPLEEGLERTIAYFRLALGFGPGGATVLAPVGRAATARVVKASAAANQLAETPLSELARTD